MRRRIGSAALAASLGVAGLGAGVVLAPAIASAATGTATAGEAVGSRLDAVRSALSGLVKDNTITQAQADKVAATLDEQLPRRGHGGPHGRGVGGVRLEAAAEALGLTEAELRTQLRTGKSLAQIAETEKVPLDTLVSALVTAAEERMAQAVTDGKLTQAQADAKKTELRTRISEKVQQAGPGGRGHRHGPPPSGPR